MNNALSSSDQVIAWLKNNFSSRVANNSYFNPGPIKFIRKEKEYVGISIRGEILLIPEIFNSEYRKLKCSCCSQFRRPNDFHWKVKGTEGPFKKIWGKRDSFCKPCRSQQKAGSYNKKVSSKKIKAQRRANAKTLDISNFKVEKTYAASPAKVGLEAANKFLIERIFARR